MPFQLRILSGKHKGAEMRLSARRYSLGSAENNTVILSDDDIEKTHISFFFSEGEISVLSAPGGLRVDGEKIDNFPIDVAPLQVMTLAGSNEKDNVSFAFADAPQEKWPDNKKIAEMLAQGEGVSNAKHTVGKTRRVEKKLGALARLSPRRRRILLRSTIALAIAICASITIFLVSISWLDPARWHVKRMQRVEQRLEQELAAKPKEQRTVYIEKGNDGSIILLGYVETEKELVRLRGLAFESGLRIRVVSKEQLQATLKVIAKQYGLYANFKLLPIGKPAIYKREISLSNGKDGYASASDANKTRALETQHFLLRAEGFIEHERRVEAFRQAVLNDLPYISEVEMDVTTNEVMLNTIRKVLARSAAFSGIKLELNFGYLVLSGAIFSNFHDELQSILQRHYLSLPHPPITKDGLVLAPPFYAQITALLLGRQRAVDLRMQEDKISKRYLIGQIVDNDKRITDIASNGIVLKYKDEKIGFPIATTTATMPDDTRATIKIKAEKKREALP